MPVSFDQNCLHLTVKPYLSSESYSRKYVKLPNNFPCMLTSNYRKIDFIEKVWLANLALFIYALTD